jgi:hypothetical protein
MTSTDFILAPRNHHNSLPISPTFNQGLHITDTYPTPNNHSNYVSRWYYLIRDRLQPRYPRSRSCLRIRTVCQLRPRKRTRLALFAFARSLDEIFPKLDPSLSVMPRRRPRRFRPRPRPPRPRSPNIPCLLVKHRCHFANTSTGHIFSAATVCLT